VESCSLLGAFVNGASLQPYQNARDAELGRNKLPTEEHWTLHGCGSSSVWRKWKHVSSDPMSAWENLRKGRMTTDCEFNVFQTNSGLRLSERIEIQMKDRLEDSSNISES